MDSKQSNGVIQSQYDFSRRSYGLKIQNNHEKMKVGSQSDLGQDIF